MSPVFPDIFSLEGRVALVTGASGGIGGAIASGLASAGAKLALHGRDTGRLERLLAEIRSAGGEAASFAADLGDLAALRELARNVVAHFGAVDILVNCAGGNKRQPILEVTPETYREIMAANLDSAFFLTQALVPGMIERRRGKIINIGSLTVATALHSVGVYGMTKSALAQLTQTMAVEWAPYNIQVNCLSPGFIATDLTRPVWENPDRSRWILDRLAIKRPGSPDDMVGMAIFLASSASDYMTGQTVYVDGGFTAGSAW